MSPEFPDDVVDGFPVPPLTFTDGEDREITIQRADESARDDLHDMYVDFKPEDRAQGIPPARAEAIEKWLDNLVTEDCLNVIAYHDSAAVGHAMLVPDSVGSYELAIFVLREYQGARIGTRLVRSLLGWGQEAGIHEVWLTVERWNDAAVRLYEKVGFETTGSQSFELEMGIRLA